jgi:hypothetical protein
MESSADANHVDEMSTTEGPVKEIEEMAKGTKTMHGNWLYSSPILATATLVSTGTYIFLRDDEDSS